MWSTDRVAAARASPLSRLSPAKLCKWGRRGSSGSPRCALPSLFPCSRLALRFPTVSQNGLLWVILRRSTPPQSSFTSNTARDLSNASSTYPGSRPSRDVTGAHPRTAKFPASLRSVLGLSQPLDGLLRSPARRLVSSRCHVQDPPVRGPPPAQPLLPRRKPRAPLPLLPPR